MQTAVYAESYVRPRYPSRIAVKGRKGIYLIPAGDIVWIEAQQYYSLLHMKDGRELVRKPLKDFERLLDPERFFRIHRSAIVNLDWIAELQPAERGRFEVRLQTGERLRMASARARDFRHLVPLVE